MVRDFWLGRRVRAQRGRQRGPLPEIHLHNILLHMMLLFRGFETYYVLSGDLGLRAP